MIKTTMRPLRSNGLRRVSVSSGSFLNQAILRPSCGATSAVCSQVCTPQPSQAGLAQAAEFSRVLKIIASGGQSSGLVYFSFPATRMHRHLGTVVWDHLALLRQRTSFMRSIGRLIDSIL